MLTVISPAKKLDFDPVPYKIPPTEPEFAADAQYLAKVASQLSVQDLQKLMKISEKLAALNRDRFQEFSANPAPDKVKPAALAFAGDTYTGLDAGSLDGDELTYAQDHLRILSGLYGLLRPMDLIQPYRLEMGSRLATDHGRTLYDYWGDRLALAINAQAERVKARYLVNCASVEYFKALQPKALKLPVITPVFMEEREAGPKVVSFYAKQARGAMARFVITNRITDIEGLKDFDTGGYGFRPDLSKDNTLVFTRG